jgi:hypothetical protein
MDSNDHNSQSISINSEVTSKAKQKRTRALSFAKKRPHQLIPFKLNPFFGFFQVPNSDICYSYPKQILSALANCDHEQFAHVVNNICDPAAEFISEYEFEQNPFGPNHR